LLIQYENAVVGGGSVSKERNIVVVSVDGQLAVLFVGLVGVAGVVDVGVFVALFLLEVVFVFFDDYRGGDVAG